MPQFCNASTTCPPGEECYEDLNLVDIKRYGHHRGYCWSSRVMIFFRYFRSSIPAPVEPSTWGEEIINPSVTPIESPGAEISAGPDEAESTNPSPEFDLETKMPLLYGEIDGLTLSPCSTGCQGRRACQNLLLLTARGQDRGTLCIPEKLELCSSSIECEDGEACAGLTGGQTVCMSRFVARTPGLVQRGGPVRKAPPLKYNPNTGLLEPEQSPMSGETPEVTKPPGISLEFTGELDRPEWPQLSEGLSRDRCMNDSDCLGTRRCFPMNNSHFCLGPSSCFCLEPNERLCIREEDCSNGDTCMRGIVDFASGTCVSPLTHVSNSKEVGV